MIENLQSGYSKPSGVMQTCVLKCPHVPATIACNTIVRLPWVQVICAVFAKGRSRKLHDKLAKRTGRKYDLPHRRENVEITKSTRNFL